MAKALHDPTHTTVPEFPRCINMIELVMREFRPLAERMSRTECVARPLNPQCMDE